MRAGLVGLAAALSLFFALPAAAQKPAVTFTAASVGAALTETGHTSTAETDDDGNPNLRVDVGTTKAEQIFVQFFDCDQAGQCDSIMLWSWFDTPQTVGTDVINDWNEDERWTRAYIDSDKDPRLEMDINAAGGIGGEAVEILIRKYFDSMNQFATHIGL